MQQDTHYVHEGYKLKNKTLVSGGILLTFYHLMLLFGL